MKLRFALLLAGLAGVIALPAHAGVDLSIGIAVPAPIVVRQAPPRPIRERVIVSPGHGYVWIAGHHAWRGDRWVWIGGVWVRPPQPGAVWVPGRWERWHKRWTEGHWEVAVAATAPGVAVPTTPPPVVVEGGAPVAVIVQAPPPPPQKEVIVVRPGPDYVWVGGYWGWERGRYVWCAGRWDRPPHGHKVWVGPRWERRGHGYVMLQGSWR